MQTFATKKSAEAASRCSSDVSFFKDVLFIFGGVGPPVWFSDDLGIRPRRGTRRGVHFARRNTALRLASLAFAPFRASQTPRRKSNTKRIHICLFLSRPAH